MPFRIGETRLLLFIIEDEKIEANNGCNSTITFSISSASTHHQKLKREPDILMEVNSVPIVADNVHIDAEEFLGCSNDGEAYSKISDLLASLCINSNDKQRIGNNIVMQTRIIARKNSSSSSGNHKLLINVEMQLKTVYWWQRTVPATCSSIANLERGRLGDFVLDAPSQCSICLDEFQALSQIKRMPCLHIFHSHCIDQWLSLSHKCPLCRFEMPASCINFTY
ncbi:hypothetical protein JCGZ_17576 [Jatropha curcas]|uniref:RING-type E3 ubiquitin transferase n=1 Tax=Jatropha curcas TaxID=180498 RepID=A0A067JUD7_JATCU|nr:E3 ubiquitin-protein ligase RNF181 [Jatropha curcas]KDP26418.1 hypothetical protein JCGZ_17576 [Jatropha curcas]